MATPVQPTVRERYAHLFRAFRYRNYRLFYAGQGISLIGTWMQQVATGWLVYRMTNSPFLLGMVGFLGNAPSLVLAPFAGVLADRWSRLKLMVAIQTLAMLQALVLAVLVLSGHITVAWILGLSIVLGVINAFDLPVRQAFVMDMIDDRDDLSNAIALNSSMVNGSRLIGPSLAGILIGLVGEGICFLANGLSYIAVIAALFAMRLRPRQTVPHHPSIAHHLKEGIRYAWEFKPIRDIILLLSVVSLMAMPYIVLMPIFARDVLKSGPNTLGFLMASVGVGALVGSGIMASRKSVRGLTRIIPMAAALFGAGLVAFSFSRFLPLSLILMAVAGVGMMLNMNSCNAVLQTIADEDKRGRIMSFYAVAFRGMLPFGSLMAGSFAAWMGAPYTLMIGGLCCILGALLFARQLPAIRKAVRPIYVQQGIIPPSPEPTEPSRMISPDEG
ncbi:MFS transporter, partial [candidate division GN15 bacterium]